MTFTEYHVTGILKNGRRFKRMTYSDPFYAFGINLWRGSVWGITKEGKRKLLKRT